MFEFNFQKGYKSHAAARNKQFLADLKCEL